MRGAGDERDPGEGEFDDLYLSLPFIFVLWFTHLRFAGPGGMHGVDMGEEEREMNEREKATSSRRFHLHTRWSHVVARGRSRSLSHDLSIAL